MHTFGKALDPLYESQTDWDIFKALAEKIAEVARGRNLEPFQDEAFEWPRDFTRLADDWSGQGAIVTDEQAADFILSNSKETQGMTYRNLQDHPRRFVATDPESWNSDVEEGVAYTPFKHQVEKKVPWRTLTGRQQFCIDHPWFLELGESLPVHKAPAEGNIPSTGTRRMAAGRSTPPGATIAPAAAAARPAHRLHAPGRRAPARPA